MRHAFLNVDYDALHFHTVIKNQHFQGTLLGERGVIKKSTLCTLLIMLTILDDPF